LTGVREQTHQNFNKKITLLLFFISLCFHLVAFSSSLLLFGEPLKFAEHDHHHQQNHMIFKVNQKRKPRKEKK
jgi:hypothetical protein